MAEILDKKRDFQWLAPPQHSHWLTVLDVIKAKTPEDYLQIVQAWAKSVYDAWSEHHAFIKSMIKYLYSKK
jgi:uncharacterized protein DUF5946